MGSGVCACLCECVCVCVCVWMGGFVYVCVFGLGGWVCVYINYILYQQSLDCNQRKKRNML